MSTALPELSEEQLVRCLVASSCIGKVAMSFESGPYDITRPSLNASRLAAEIHKEFQAAIAADRAARGEPVGVVYEMSNGERHIRACTPNRLPDPGTKLYTAPADRGVVKQPSVDDLLVWAVEDGVIRLSQVMDADLQDSLLKFAQRLAAPTQPKD